MRAVVYTGPSAYRVTDVPPPVPGPAEVRIRVERVGVCGTDLHVHHASIPVGSPVIPGHEIVGVVDLVGAGVTTVRVGDRVVVNPNITCGVCDVCRRRPSMQCRRIRGLGVGEDGGLAEQVVAPEGNVFPVGDLPPDLAAFAEPVACVLHGVERLDPGVGDSAVVFGAGPSAAIMVAVLRARGVGPITVAAPEGAKLRAMGRYGATGFVALDRSDPDLADSALIAASSDRGFDLAIDVTGVAGVMALALRHVGAGGTVMPYGVADPGAVVGVRPYDLFLRDLTIVGSFAQTTSMPAAIAFLRSGAFDPRPLVTHEFPLEDWARAIDAVENDRTVHKAVIVMEAA
ncbi:alcohol dehydrogenase catalytic domain-containing protein [Microbacterium oryzae]|uniref:alcohol dehydrogenase catalytic domain-containing protein n=1 Tax=Microbacterium oryzae TaxID=743009 RepID=UPI0025B2383C|nr:alcohol dehydrogenase catalytic domain-containing protein [Microbacterium oryzae]MDN3310188.1 alcohol dehydrogenase catalytic domain-containing protein [Microbacterium oryzae]